MSTKAPSQPETQQGPETDTPQHHDPLLAHHFGSRRQQFEAGKLAMWIFLATELLFFGGLFVAYTVFRSSHPEVFVSASKHLSTTLGALNTGVLLFSSLTMAWAVRCAQLGQRRGLMLTLVLTLASAGFFLGVKLVEYTMKWDEGLLWAGAFAPTSSAGQMSSLIWAASPFWLSIPVFGLLIAAGRWLNNKMLRDTSAALLASMAALLLGTALAATIVSFGNDAAHHSAHEADHAAAETDHKSDGPTKDMAAAAAPGMPADAASASEGIFFSIYFSMTALHALHILIGMGVIGWLVWLTAAGSVGPDRFAAVDFVGLYWHLVDLVWIFLFPMLYLIQ